MRFSKWILCFLCTVCLTSCGATNTNLAYKHAKNSTQLAQKKAIKNKNAPTIVIDAGHGGFDLGAHTRICEEKDACLKTALFLRKFLEEKGYRVIMTRSRDEFIPLKKRAEIANKNRAQVLVSVHFNSAKNQSAHGIEIFYSDKTEPWRIKKSKELAQTVLAKLLSQTGALSRGVKTGNFCVIRETHMPSILVEGGFLTNEDELKLISDDRYLSKIASAISDALDVYFAS